MLKKLTSYQLAAYSNLTDGKSYAGTFIAPLIPAVLGSSMFFFGLPSVGVGLSWTFAFLMVLATVSNCVVLSSVTSGNTSVCLQVLSSRAHLDAAVKTYSYTICEILIIAWTAVLCVTLWVNMYLVTGTLLAIASCGLWITKEILATQMLVMLQNTGLALQGKTPSGSPIPQQVPQQAKQSDDSGVTVHPSAPSGVYKGEGCCELLTGCIEADDDICAANLDTREMIGVKDGDMVKITAPSGISIVRRVVKVPRHVMNVVHGRIFITKKDYSELEVAPDPQSLKVFVEPAKKEPLDRDEPGTYPDFE
jgi:hypothetical protein